MTWQSGAARGSVRPGPGGRWRYRYRAVFLCRENGLCGTIIISLPCAHARAAPYLWLFNTWCADSSFKLPPATCLGGGRLVLGVGLGLGGGAVRRRGSQCSHSVVFSPLKAWPYVMAWVHCRVPLAERTGQPVAMRSGRYPKVTSSAP